MKKILALIVMSVMLSSGVASVNAADNSQGFSDVSETHWAKDAIDSMAQVGVITGYQDGSFKPEAPVSREEFAQLITKSFYLDLPANGSKQTFEDVGPDRWSFGAIEAAKEFLTGYYPPSGKSFFDPKGKATREDIAVALVKALRYEPDDLENKNILSDFGDWKEVSPSMQTYIAIAVEKNLITGYADQWGYNRTFKPQNPVTRAEASTLLYRVIKSAVGDSNQELELNISAPETVSNPSFYISGDVTKGAKVFINNKEIEVVQGSFRVGFSLEEEGIYTYTISARLPGGKTTQVTKKVKFEKGAPTVEVKGVPETTGKQSITVSWTVKDENDYSPTVTLIVNGEEKRLSYQSSYDVTLQEGANSITIKAVNAAGKSAEVTKTVIYSAGAPKLSVDPLPATTSKDNVTVSWKVTDANDYNPVVYVNDKKITWGNSEDVALKPGINTIVVKAVNAAGKSTEVKVTIEMSSTAPTLTVNPIPTTTTTKDLTISWSISDINDYSPVVYVNDKKVSWGNSQDILLKEGVNTITVKATNKLGQSTEVTKTITFEPPAPELKLGYAPTTTTERSVSISWTVSDINDYNPSIYINDKKVSWGNSQELSLDPGVNVFRILAVNSYGKQTTVVYEVFAE
ncbi:hypothetical protein PA598K_04868 [Paenibacillus sp. 598K]|uniref:S-layer homology domain-containing protein n=1 Tax=Paenibacillus sp. 598K TaxID=1117987 RepID=UPI000FF9405D|nr:S-layer homology domain-containing protein [Paenibacillus sp. 598K]GBF76402.1 hypothetical protein PA598K_04868 [Paenibacillus sp. 598K]